MGNRWELAKKKKKKAKTKNKPQLTSVISAALHRKSKAAKTTPHLISVVSQIGDVFIIFLPSIYNQ